MFILNPHRLGVIDATDPYFGNVVSLLHMDSPSVVDVTGKSWTVSSGGINTSLSVFGGASCYFDYGGYANTANHADWNFGSGDFTIEGRAWNFGAHGGIVGGIFGKATAGVGYAPFLIYQSGGNLYFFSSSSGSSWDIANFLFTSSIGAGAWYAWAVSRVGNNFYMLLNGTLVHSFSSSATLLSNSDDVEFSRYNGGTVQYWQGYQDEIRVTKGVGRYTASYTLATSAFPDYGPPGAQTWNPATKGSGVVLSGSDLTADIGPTVSQNVFSTGTKVSGKYYAEVLIGTQSPGLTAVHVGIAAPARTGTTAGTPDGSNAVSTRLNDGGAYGASATSGSAYSAGDVIGIAFDYSAKTVNFYKNNSANGSASFTATQGGRVFAFQNNNNGETHLLTIRTTTAEFSYTPPTGYSAWGGV